MIFFRRLIRLIREAISNFLLTRLCVGILNLLKYPNCYIHVNARVRHSKLGIFSAVHQNAKIINSNIGSLTYIGPLTVVSNAVIGTSCSVAPGVVIGLVTHRDASGKASFIPNIKIGLDNGEYGPLYKYARLFLEDSQMVGADIPKPVMKKVKIGDNVYIGQNTLISEGVTIGSNVIIGCNSFVTRDLSSNATYGGIPVRTLRDD
jgi:acetyltransferase-like isoleucine patch superfamily enzyme